MKQLRAIIAFGLLMAVTHVMGYTITVDPIEFEAGKSTSLVINLSNTETNLTAYQMFLYLPSGVTVQKKNTGKYAFTANQTRHDGNFTFSVKDAADGSILISCFSADKDVLTGTSGELIRLPIEVASTVTTSLQGSIKNIEFTDISTQAHKIANVNFAMTMEGIDPPAVTDEVTISVPDMGISAGGSADLIVNMQTSKTNLTAYQMFLYLPSGVTVQKKANGKYDYTANADRHDGSFTISVKDAADGSILISCFSADKDVLTGTNGELIRLPIEVASTVTTSLQGSIKNIEFTDVSTQAHRLADVQFNMSLTSGVSGINFADAKVKAICVANWDTNSDGELSEEEAAAVTGIGTVFRNNTEITSFREFEYFTGVSALDDYALSGCSSLETIEFPSSLTTIGKYALSNSALENLVIPGNITSIGNSAFRNCAKLVTLKVGKSSVSFGKNVFRSCTMLATVTFDGTCYFRGEDAFKDCNSLSSVVITDLSAWCKSTFSYGSSNPISITKCLVLQTSDNNSVIKNLVIPNDITELNNYVFYMCESLESVQIPSSVTTISYSAFEGCSGISSIVVDEGNPFYDSRENCNAIIEKSSNTLVCGCKSTVIPSSVTSIGNYAFYGCSGLTSVIIPNSVTSVGNYAFSGCSGLTSVTVEATEPIAISSYVFPNPANITLHVPRGCKAAYEAADYWKTFKEIIPKLGNGDTFTAYTEEGVKMTFKVISEEKKTCQVGENAWNLCSIDNLTTGKVTIPSTANGYTVTTIGGYSFRGCNNVTSIIIPNTVEDIGGYAFIGELSKENLTSLESIVIPPSVKSIGAYAFSGTCLTSITIPASVTYIDGSAFDSCSRMTSMSVDTDNPKYDSRNNCNAIIETASNKLIAGISITAIPSDVTSIGERAFFGIKSLNEITLSPAVDVIGEYAFYGCESLKNITIEGNVSTINYYAFGNCPSLEKFSINRSEPLKISTSYNGDIFEKKNIQNAILYVPAGSKSAYNAVFPWNYFKEIVEMVKPNDGSAEAPFACAEALTFVIGLTADQATETEYYIKGKVCAMQENFSYKYGNATFRISDDGTDNGSFTVYRTKYFEGAGYAGGRVPNIGDEVVLCGKLINYEGTTPETASNQCRLVSLNNKTVGTDLEVGELFVAKTPEDVEMFFVVDNTGISLGKTNVIGCSVGYAVGNRPETYTNAPACIAANYEGAITIPETAGGLPVQAIAPSAFVNTKITSVTIPASVWDIETYAFSGCKQLASVSLPENVYLNVGTFQNCTALTEINLPKGTQIYGSYGQERTFSGCSNLTAIKVNDETPYVLEGSYLVDDPSSVTLYVPVGSKAAYEAADYWKEFKEIVEGTPEVNWTNLIANSDMEGDDVTCFFSRENFLEDESVVHSTIVDGAGKDDSRGIVVHSVDNPAEEWTSQFFVRLPKPLPAGTAYKVRFDYKASQEAEVATEAHSEPGAFIYWEGVGTLNFTTKWQTYEHVGTISAEQSPEDNMQTIAFRLSKPQTATNYYFDNFVFEIDSDQPIPFADADVKALCVSNWDINGDGELSIAEAAAATNEQFAALSFESVTADKWTFDELQYFTGLTVLNTKLAETKISSVNIPVTVTEIGSDAFRKTLLTSITLPDAVKKVGERAFAECGELVTADLGNVEEIEVNAFIATSIVNLTIPGTVKTVGLEPFSWNWTMKQATLEEGVTKVPETMFHGNVNLTTVSLPSTLTTIESRAFQQCEALTTILIPAGVTTIDEQAFNKCTSLVEVTVANPNPVAITEEVFSNRKNATLYVPDGCVDAYKTADYWKEFKKILVVGTTEQVNETDITQMPNAIYMESVTGRAGRKFWADLKLKNESGIRAYNFDLQLPVGVTIATDEEGNYIYEHGNRHEGAELNLNYNEASSTYYMSVIDNMAAGNGTIWRLSLKVADGLTLGNYPIVVTNVKYTPADGQDTQNIPDATSILTVEEHGTMKGDANDDDIVNIADVVSIVNHSIHLENAVFIESSADVTGNGEADLTDAVRIIDYIVGRIDDLTSAPAASRALKASALSFASSAPMMTQETKTRATASAPAKAPDVSELTNAIYAYDLSVKPGETCQLAISLKNAKTTNGYQFQLELPEGVTIPKDEKDKYACELSTRHNGHIVDINYKDGAYKVVVYSMSSKALTGNDGEILTVQLQAADAMANDIYTVSIKEAAYSLVSGLSVSLPKADITLSVNNSLKGDANGDGNVNIADAISIVDHLLGKDTSAFNQAAADVNGDGVVDIADAVAIVNVIIK